MTKRSNQDFKIRAKLADRWVELAQKCRNHHIPSRGLVPIDCEQGGLVALNPNLVRRMK